MELAADSRISHYRILSKIGEGGMGEVYRARDERLDRDVAIKLLPARFAADPERLVRFGQEAKATSALSHPNILAVHDIGEFEGTHYIVSEFLEGEELRDRLEHGPIPARKAAEFASQIASGLSAAHEKGIVHRDLKPENIFVTKDERAKILDFGLAKLRENGSDTHGSEDATRKALTSPGAVMGTVGYMSPEQVRGHSVDHRSDIFSFGVILYEMITGRRAFQQETMAETMSAILKEEPPEMTDSNPNINPALERIVRRCLEKKPERRFHSAHDLGFALEAVSVPSGAPVEATAVMSAVKSTSRRSRLWMWPGIALALISLAVIFLLMPFARSSSDAVPTTWLEIGPPHKQFAFQPAPAISPDGRQIAFWAPDEDGRMGLWVRSLDAAAARLLPGTFAKVEYAYGTPPFWSPDGRSLGFFADGKLKRIDLAGGEPQTLADAANPRGGSWGATGVIIFVPTPAQTQAVYQVPAAGGEATPLPLSIDSNMPVTWPQFLPDGRHFFVTTTTDGVFVGTLDAKEARQVSKVMSRMEYADGYVFFGQNGSLFAQPFDEQRLELSGEPFRIAENLGFSYGEISAFSFSVSPSRNLVFWSGTWQPLTQLTWFSRAGERLETVGEPGEYSGFALSPTGRQAVLERHDPKTSSDVLWLLDTTTGVGSKFQAASGNPYEACPVWSPTDDRVFFVAWPGGVQALALGGGEIESLYSDVGWLYDISPDGQYAVLGKNDSVTGEDMWLLPLTGERKARPFMTTKINEWCARFSPDGRWIAYASDESGRLELYVQSFPEPGRKLRISNNGGLRPEWRKDGKELYYLAPDGKLMVAAVNGEGQLFQASLPQPLFTVRASDAARQQYLASADGTRFLVNAQIEDASPRTMTVVMNWKVDGNK